MRIASSTARLALAATLWALLFGFISSSGRAGDERQDELVPGLDMWSESYRAAPDRESKESVPDLLPRAKRHRKFMAAGVPLEYRGSKNPYPQATMIIDGGGRLYEQHCASCHGARGSGNGEAGRDLTPPPAFLAYLIKRPEAVDQYLLWTVSEGGAEFDSDMPAFKDTLTDQQIWRIVTYMRADFPDIAGAGRD